MTVPSTGDTEPWRLAVEETTRRRQAKREARAELSRRRDVGKARRHAARLRQLADQPNPSTGGTREP